MAKYEIDGMLKKLSTPEIQNLLSRAGLNPAPEASRADLCAAVVDHYRKPNGVYDMRRFAHDITASPRVGRTVRALAALGR